MRRVTVLYALLALMIVVSATGMRTAHADKAKGTFPGTLIATLDVRTSVQYYSGSFTAKKQEDRFAFTAYDGMTYYFCTTGDRKTKGAIYDASGDILEKDNNSGEGQNFSITWTADFSGTAYLGVIEQGKAIGAYTLAYYFALVGSEPEAPASLAASLESETSVSLSWLDVLGEDGFVIYRDGEEIDRVADDVTSYTDTFSFVAGAWYTYSVSAYNSVGESDPTFANAVLPHVAAPASVEATLNSQTSVTITWSEVEGETGYIVYRDGVEIARTTGNSYTDDYSFAAGTSYAYSVSAYNSVGESEAAAAGAVMPLVGAPSALTATLLSSTSVLLEWDDVAGETGYIIYLNGAEVAFVSSNTTSYTDSYAFAAGTSYTYSVSACNDVSESSATEANPFSVTSVVQVAAGSAHTLVLYSDGSVYSWGSNNMGQLGLGNNTDKNTPQLVSALSGKGVVAIAAGYWHSIALCSDGKVYIWGYNQYGTLGLGNSSNKNTPQLVTALSSKTVIAVAAGCYFSLALCSDGAVYGWGSNDSGQLGLGYRSNEYSPRLISAVSDKGAIALVPGDSFALVLCSDGAVYAMGGNTEGQLGLGDNSHKYTPLLVTGLSGKGVVEVAAGQAHSLARCSDGSVYAWGRNTKGGLGLGHSTSKNTPQLVSGLSGVGAVKLTAGRYQSFALCSDGSVLACGYNGNGELGLGDNTDRNTPQPVSSLSGEGVIDIAAAWDYCFAFCLDGPIYAWGLNEYGQLGLGDYTSRNTPTLVTMP
ncbi:MAG: hypothetical protein WC712_07635 [Candidatus Brocadiia bacterium]